MTEAVFPAPQRPAGESLVAFERRAFYDDIVWHDHRDLELTLVLEGSGRRGVAGGIEPFADGDLCLLGEGARHGWASPPLGRGIRARVVHFPRRLLELSESVPEARAAGALLDAARGGLLLTGRTRDLVAAELEALFREPLGSWRRPLHLLGALWAAAEGAERRPLNSWDSAEGAAARDPRLRSVLAYVAANLSSGVQHAGAAAMAGLTPAAFSRFFRRATGRTFERFVSDARVSRACQALLESDAPITDVAFAAGFGSIGDFNRRFLDSTGVTPTRYRARRLRQ